MSAARDTSGSGVTSMQEERRVPHANLIQSLTHQMGGQEIKDMKDYLLLRQTISRKQYEELDGLPAIVHCLEMEMKITIGQRDGYKVLIDALKTIRKDALADEVEQHQKKFCTDGDADKADKNQFQDLLTQLASKNETIECLKKEKEELRDELSDLKKLGVTKSEEISNLRGEFRGLHREVDSLKKNIHLLRSQVEVYDRTLSTKENDYKRLQEKFDTTKREKRDLPEKLRTLTMKNTELQKELDTTKMENTELQKELDTTKKKLHEQEQEGVVEGAEGGTGDVHVHPYQEQEGVQLAKGPRDIERCEEVVTEEYGTSIQSIVNLSERFAVAHGPSWDEIKGVDIYDKSGVKQRTLKAHIKGLRHLAVTPDKWILVAICNEGLAGPYTIRLFDPVSGYIRSTPQFSLEWGVHGFDVCDRRQFIILHGDPNKVTVVREDGSVVLTEKIKFPSHSISCGGKYVYTSRGGHYHYVDVYEITEDRHLKHIATSQQFDLVNDVSATAAGEVTVTCKRGKRWYLGRATFKDNKFSEWRYKDFESRWQWVVSVGGDHVVVAGEDNNNRIRILRVFKEED